MMDRFAEGQEILVFPADGGDFPADFAERLTAALEEAGIDWVYA